MPKEWYNDFNLLWTYPCWAETEADKQALEVRTRNI
jgi:hypothetical protein